MPPQNNLRPETIQLAKIAQNDPFEALQLILASEDPFNLGIFAAALYYVGFLNLPVFPIWWALEEGGCACGNAKCGSPGKHPLGKLVPNGYKDATTDLNVAASWWHRYPSANIGVPTGAASGFFAIDIDPRNGGDVSFDLLEDEFGRIPDTVEQITGGGGRHLLFKHPGFPVPNDNNGRLFGPGIDVKGDGGYIIVPPSNHV